MSSATTAMPHNDSDASEATEFELVLGNKQLLSVFFIVVVLLGVFFTMGYIVGKNSAPVGAASTGSGEAYDRTSAPSAMPSNGSQAPVAISDQPAAASSTDTATAQQTVQDETSAAQRTVEIPVVAAAQPQEGQTYLQVVAVARTEADVLAEVLGKKGFRAFVAPVENNAKLYRVLVGPASDINDVSRLKGDLEAAGFKPFVKKY